MKARRTIIRPARMADCQACYQLGCIPELAISRGRYLPIEAYRIFIRDRQFFLVATVRKTIVGFAMAERLAGHGLLLQYMAIAPELRGQGIGRKLLDAVLARGRQAGIMWAMTYAVASSQPMLKLLKTSGFSRNHLVYEFSRQLQYWPSEKKTASSRRTTTKP